VNQRSMIEEPTRHLPVWADVDVCVIGGSCTSVFAAVRAAGAAAVLALHGSGSVAEVDAAALRRTLAEGGSLVL
jgi:hypothetical protein